jgi:hypothetical protein
MASCGPLLCAILLLSAHALADNGFVQASTATETENEVRRIMAEPTAAVVSEDLDMPRGFESPIMAEVATAAAVRQRGDDEEQDEGPESTKDTVVDALTHAPGPVGDTAQVYQDSVQRSEGGKLAEAGLNTGVNALFDYGLPGYSELNAALPDSLKPEGLVDQGSPEIARSPRRIQWGSRHRPWPWP